MGLGFETDRLKTGTPARVDSRTVNFASLEAQPGDTDVRWFSFDTSVSLSHFMAFNIILPHCIMYDPISKTDHKGKQRTLG